MDGFYCAFTNVLVQGGLKNEASTTSLGETVPQPTSSQRLQNLPDIPPKLSFSSFNFTPLLLLIPYCIMLNPSFYLRSTAFKHVQTCFLTLAQKSYSRNSVWLILVQNLISLEYSCLQLAICCRRQNIATLLHDGDTASS